MLVCTAIVAVGGIVGTVPLRDQAPGGVQASGEELA